MSVTTEESAGAAAIRPFTVEIPETEIEALRARVTATRWPHKELVDDWSQGVQLAMLQELARYWAADYDWRRCEARLNALPQFTTEIDGVDIHFIHVKSSHENALPLIITHGFSGEPTEVGWDSGRIASAWAELMRRLGYSRYVAQGGDQGAGVTDALGRLAPEGLLGVHFNLLSAAPRELVMAAFNIRLAFSMEDREELSKVVAVFMRGYIGEMGEHPQTIGYPLLDSPLGLAAWMLDHDADAYEKISHAFTGGQPSGGLTRDHVLDNITLYWLTGTAASAARLYWETGRGAKAAIKHPPPHLTLPVAYTVFPDELFQAPRHWVKSAYHNLIYFNEAAKGGHFAAWEEPQLFSEEMRAAFRTLR